MLASAEKLFSERAYGDVRVEEIAEDADVAKGLVYYHFENKRGIYAAVIEAMAEDVMSRTQVDHSLPPYERTVAVIESFIEWAVQVERFTKAFSSGPGADPVVTRVINDTMEHHVDAMLAGMKEAASELDVEDATGSPLMRHAIKGWVAFVWTVTMDWIADRDVSEDDLRDLFIHALGGSITAAQASIRG